MMKDEPKSVNETIVEYPIDDSLLGILLVDRTTNKNIFWGTNNYLSKGFKPNDTIEISSITGKHIGLIKPRVEKSKSEQRKRSKDKGEVFTPSWMCNKQNNEIDGLWFGKSDIFNIETDKGWKSQTSKIQFPKGKTWMDYVLDLRLEITCGEAPYLVSRYDTVNGSPVPLASRIGLLDRKLRVVDENAANDEEWMIWTKKAFQSVYGFDYQGDNVLIARKNLLYSFIDVYLNRFRQKPSDDLLFAMAEIISWNIWQMDGMKFVVPGSCVNRYTEKVNLFGDVIIEGQKCPGCEKNDIYKHNGKYCKIMDWQRNKKIEFINMIKEWKTWAK